VLGDRCRLDHAAQLAGVDTDAAAAVADALSSAGLLLGTGPGLSFAHPILRSAVLGDVGRHELARWHARAARLLIRHGVSAGVVATHLLRCEPAADDEVAGILLEAAREAMGAGSPVVAIRLLRRALEEPPAPTHRGTHLFELGVAEAARADLAALEHLTASIAAADRPEVRAERALVFAELARKAALAGLADFLSPALDELDTALAALEPDTPSAMVTSLQRYWIGRTTVSTIGRVRAARVELDRAGRADDPAVRREAAVFLAMEAALAGTRDDVDRHLEVALAPPGLLAHVAPDSNAVNVTLLLLTMLERHQAFRTVSLEVLAEAGRSGNEMGHAVAAIHRGMELLRLGRPQAADAEVLTSMALGSELGWPHGSPDLLATHVLACLWRGDVASGRRAVDGSGFALDPPDTVPAAMLLDARGLVALAEGSAEAALRDFVAAGECLTALGIPNPGMLAWRSHASTALLALGRTDEARVLAEQELALARERAGPAAQAAALRALAASQDRDSAVETLVAALEVVEESPAMLERASVRIDLGSALRRRGFARDARPHLAEAVDLGTRFGAPLLAGRAREELIAAGGRPRRTSVTGPSALTPSESRVARLAKDGMTNSVIAQTLFVSRKTVEKHLANAYAKLGISARSGLAGIDLG
jgi:DNA-binding CsgD family transcriptional regulator